MPKSSESIAAACTGARLWKKRWAHLALVHRTVDMTIITEQLITNWQASDRFHCPAVLKHARRDSNLWNQTSLAAVHLTGKRALPLWRSSRLAESVFALFTKVPIALLYSFLLLIFIFTPAHPRQTVDHFVFSFVSLSQPKP